MLVGLRKYAPVVCRNESRREEAGTFSEEGEEGGGAAGIELTLMRFYCYGCWLFRPGACRQWRRWRHCCNRAAHFICWLFVTQKHKPFHYRYNLIRSKLLLLIVIFFCACEICGANDRSVKVSMCVGYTF